MNAQLIRHGTQKRLESGPNGARPSRPPVEVRASGRAPSSLSFAGQATRGPGTLDLYKALESVPLVEKIPATPIAPVQGASTHEKTDPTSRARPSFAFSQTLRDCTVTAAWWLSLVAHALLVLCLIMAVGSHRSTPASGAEDDTLTWLSLHPHQPEEVVNEMVIPIVRSEYVEGIGESAQGNSETTVVLEISIDADGKSRLISARSARVPEGPVNLSCARISVAATPSR